MIVSSRYMTAETTITRAARGLQRQNVEDHSPSGVSRQPHGEDGALAGGVRTVISPPWAPGEVATDRQTEAAAVRRGIAHGIAAEEALEQAALLGEGDPGAIVGHDDRDRVQVLLHGTLTAASRGMYLIAFDRRLSTI